MLPKPVPRPAVPPLKCQGIKTKLVDFVASGVRWRGDGRWIEPFLGSGAVLFSLAPPRALATDTNQHIIAFYQALQSGTIDERIVREHLTREGQRLKGDGQSVYYEIRDRFNCEADPLDFLFLNRACFNGVMRFNRRGQFNVPFCRKPGRFSAALVTRICNQVLRAREMVQQHEWTFRVADWRSTLAQSAEQDFVYCDPPYIARHSDYFNRWSDDEAVALARQTQQLSCGYAVSMWLENRYRRNAHIDNDWSGCTVHRFRHYYHVGPALRLRNEMVEALIVKPSHAVSG